MSLGIAADLTLLRSVCLALLAIVPASYSAALLAQSGPRLRPALWMLVWAPLLTPDIVISYGYLDAALASLHRPWQLELLYCGLLLLKTIPVATLAIYFAPTPSLSEAAFHCRRLSLANRRGFDRWGPLISAWLRGPGRRTLPALALVAVIVFQEFELATSLKVAAPPGGGSWTIRLFDAQAGGLPWQDSLRLAVRPMLTILILLIPAALLIHRGQPFRTTTLPQTRRLGGPVRLAVIVFQGLTVLIICVIPSVLILAGASRGAPVLFAGFPAIWEIVHGLTSALVAGIAAYLLAGFVIQRTRGILWLTWLPGLAGSLVLGLVLFALFDTLGAHRLQDSGLPWIIGLVLSLLPRACLLRWLLDTPQAREPTHLAVLLFDSPDPRTRAAAAGLEWQLRRSGAFWIIVLLCHWAYWELTLGSILAPSRLVPITARLYNLMHFGRSDVLSATLVAAAGIPLMLIPFGYLIARYGGGLLSPVSPPPSA